MTLRASLTCLILVALLALVAVAQTRAGGRALRSMGLSKPSRGYTELYFADPVALANLGRWAHPGPARNPVWFVIGNRSSRAQTYRWSITEAGVERASGDTMVAARQSVTVRRLVLVRCPLPPSAVPPQRSRRNRSRSAASIAGPRRIRVAVTLERPRQAIDYWVQCRT